MRGAKILRVSIISIKAKVANIYLSCRSGLWPWVFCEFYPTSTVSPVFQIFSILKIEVIFCDWERSLRKLETHSLNQHDYEKEPPQHSSEWLKVNLCKLLHSHWNRSFCRCKQRLHIFIWIRNLTQFQEYVKRFHACFQSRASGVEKIHSCFAAASFIPLDRYLQNDKSLIFHKL